MMTFTDEQERFANNILLAIKSHKEELSAAEIIGTLRIISASMEAKQTGGTISVQIVNIEEDQPEQDPDSWWKEA